MSSANRWSLICLGLIGLCWLTSGYLLTRLLQLSGAPSLDACAVFGVSCDPTLGKSSSWQLGVPLPGWGLIYFALLGVLISWGSSKSLLAARLLSAAGAGASLVLISFLLMDLAHLCLFCLVVQFLNLCLFLALGKLCNSLPTPSPRPAKRRPRLSSSVALVFGLVGQAILMLFGTAPGSLDTEALLANYLAAPKQEVRVDPGDPALGAGDSAPAQLVVFSSFQCPACQRFGLQTRHIQEHFGDQVSIVFKHFPLSSECNPSVRADLQPHACTVSRAAEAARRQGRFWEFHDAFYAKTLAGSEAALQSTAVSVGLDLERWKVDREAKDTRERIERNIQLATELGVNYTPAIFLNGRRVPTSNLVGVALLIKHELDAAAGLQ